MGVNQKIIKKSKKKKWVNFILYLSVVFIFQELLFRFLFPVPEIQNFDRVNYMVLHFDGSGNVHRRDQDWIWQSSPDTSAQFLHQMNKYGFRDKEWYVERESGKKRALFIGDSFVEGVMAGPAESIPEVFKRSSEKNDYEVFNCGMVGCGLSSYLQLAADIVPLYKPNVAFLCIYGNDLGREEPNIPGLYLEPEYFNLFKPRLAEVVGQMKTYGPLRVRWKSDILPYLNPVPDKSNPWTENGEIFKKDVAPRLATEMKAARFNPFLVNALAKEEQYLLSPSLIGETIPFFKYTCDQNGSVPVVIYIPSRNQVTDYYLPFEREYCLHMENDSVSLTDPQYQKHQEEVAKQCVMHGVQFMDLTSVIREKELAGEHLYWNYDQHMRARGYMVAGEAIWEFWENKNTEKF
jgi:lysophospholipase L1-like esterase